MALPQGSGFRNSLFLFIILSAVEKSFFNKKELKQIAQSLTQIQIQRKLFVN